jgi:uncharacterized membrane protein
MHVAPATPLAPTAPARRLASVDLIRGAVMILMAIDHVRVYSGLPPGGPTAGIFLTRWVTHFCAPAFIFLAGTSAYFYGRVRPGLPRFLLARGAWLVLLELTVIRVAWTFNLDFAHYLLAGVIWVIGWSMILMAGLVRLPLGAIAALGVALIAGHNLIPMPQGDVSALANVLYAGFWAGPMRLGAEGPDLIVLYSLVPWIGVMATGYAFGRWLTLEPARRDRLCLQLGIGGTLLFIVLRASGVYGEPRPWDASQGLLGLLNTTKYPASLVFLLMTLGPTIALIPVLERARGALAGAVAVFGRVPFFYYVSHIPLIHALALTVSWIRLGQVSPWLFANHPMGNPPPPEGYVWSLPLLYLVFAVAIALLYPACRWFADLKSRRTEWWLKYL